ncbi:MAG: hypothetical protein ACOY9Y_08430 [Bacillota bacterium]
MSVNINVNAKPEQHIPKSFFEYVKSFGPGIVLVLSWLGAGDLVDNSIAGAHYGYALMWALVIAFITRIVLVSIIARYPIYNLHGDTILGGYYRVNKFYPLVLGASGVLMGFFYNTYMIRGSGEALFNITHVASPFFWSIIAVIAGVAITARSIYKHVELTEKIILTVVMQFQDNFPNPIT